jgi:hypothetical protein
MLIPVAACAWIPISADPGESEVGYDSMVRLAASRVIRQGMAGHGGGGCDYAGFFYGQLRFRSWAPSLAVSSTLAGLLLSCFTGRFCNGVGDAALVRAHVERVALILPYASAEVRALFWPQAAAAAVDTAAGLRLLAEPV